MFHVLITVLTLFSLTGLSSSADHTTFKNCSRVDFCNTLRTRVPSDDYILDPTTVTLSSDNETLTATLRSTDKANLTLTLNGLQQNTFRLKIAEAKSSRYELQDVLNGTPIPLRFDDINIGTASLNVTTASGLNSVVVTYSPFTIEFSTGETSKTIFNGTQLYLETNDVTAPFAFGVTFPQAVQLYGLHEHCDTLALKNTSPNGTDPYRLKNSDVGYYEIESPMALYGAVPVLYGHGSNGTAGVFLHNAAEQWIETTSSDGGNSKAYFMVETGTLDLFVLLGPTISDVVRQYTGLTGTAPVPPLWSLGYHQSRYNYESQDDVINVTSSFDSNNFQLDAIWLDIDYTDAFKYFTWNPSTFSDPLTLQETLSTTNKKLVTIIDPHVKVEEGYSVYDGALINDFFVKNPNGSIFQGTCWPGTSSYIDFLNPAARNFLASMYYYDNFRNSTSVIGGIWNDMNEPSVFDNSLEMTLPPDSLHIGNVTHREVHNIYGLLQTMATYNGLLSRDDNQRRPFVLTRSHFAGSQRFAAFWTGDSQADWPYLHAAFQECLNANLLGLVFCGADIGGFFNNPSTELLERWYQAGAWLPFFRSHSNKDTDRREPYLFPEDTQEVIRSAIQTRYRHIPHWYTLMYEHSRTGDPVIRPLFYHYPEDTNVFGIDNELLVGRDILIRAVTESGVESVEVYFPGGEEEVWFSISGSDVQRGTGFVDVPVDRNIIPLYYRRGGVVVTKDRIRPNTVEMVDDEYTMFYAVNHSSQAHGTIYVDDGISFKYKDSADFNYNNIEVHGDDITIVPIDGNGDYEITIIQFVKREILKMPENGRPGTYKETVYTKCVDDVLLKDIRIKLNQTTFLQLK